VYGIERQSGGHIGVYSEVGRGTTFKVYLPRVEGPAEVPLEIPRGVPAVRGTETILLAEDEPGVRALAAAVLRDGGYCVIETANGEEALAVCRSHPDPIHVMVTDVVMPELSGPDLARAVGSLRPEMRVLFLSGYTHGTLGHQGRLPAGVAFLPKPFTPDELARKVREVLQD